MKWRSYHFYLVEFECDMKIEETFSEENFVGGFFEILELLISRSIICGYTPTFWISFFILLFPNLETKNKNMDPLRFSSAVVKALDKEDKEGFKKLSEELLNPCGEPLAPSSTDRYVYLD